MKNSNTTYGKFALENIEKTAAVECEKCRSPPIEEENMNNSGSKAGKIDAIIDSKEGAHIEGALSLVCINVKAEVGIYNS